MSRWHRDTWAEAVWTSKLRPLQRLVALAFADHARDRDTAWVTYPRLMERTGLSRDAVARHLRVLVDTGWLLVVTPASQHKATEYRLTFPQESVTRTADASSSPPDVPLDDAPAVRETDLWPSQQYAGQTAGPPQQSGPASQQSVSAAPEVREADPTSVPTSLPTPPRRGRGETAMEEGLMASHGLTAAEAAEVVRRSTEDPKTINVAARLRQDTYVRLLVDAVRADERKAMAAEVDVLRRGPECPHGVQGGASLHPETGQPLCPLCRAEQRRSA